MKVKRGSSGQTLVETALAIPLLGLFVFGVGWLICYAHNSIALQQMALDKARLITVDPTALMAYLPSVRLWGQSTPPIARPPSTALVAHWRPFIPIAGLATVQTAPGSISRIRCDAVMYGRTPWTSYFLPRVMETTAETLIEPPVPPES